MLERLPASQPLPLLIFFHSGVWPAHYYCNRFTTRGDTYEESPLHLPPSRDAQALLVPSPWALFGDSRKKCVWVWAPLGAQVSKPTQSGSGKRDGGPWGK